MAQSCSLCLLVCDCHPAVVSRTVSPPHPPTSCFPNATAAILIVGATPCNGSCYCSNRVTNSGGATYRASDECRSVGAEWEVIYQQVSSALDGCFYQPARPKQEATEEKRTVTVALFTDRRRLAVQYCAKVLGLFISCGLDLQLSSSLKVS